MYKLSKYVKRWNIPVTDHLDKQLEEYIEEDAFSTKSEFVRTAVRDRLEKEREKLRLQQGEARVVAVPLVVNGGTKRKVE